MRCQNCGLLFVLLGYWINFAFSFAQLLCLYRFVYAFIILFRVSALHGQTYLLYNIAFLWIGFKFLCTELYVAS